MLHTETVTPQTLALIQKLMADPTLNNFYLVGGTALALKIGHRLSIDLDFFTNDAFDAQTISSHLNKTYGFQSTYNTTNTLKGDVGKVKIDMIRHNYKLLQPVHMVGGVRLLSLSDIAAMKVGAIASNGTRLKDFVDIYCLLEIMTMKEIIQSFLDKYPDTNAVMAKNSLLYLDEIDFTIPIKIIGRESLTRKDLEKRFTKAFQFPNKRIKNTPLKRRPGKRKGRGI